MLANAAAAVFFPHYAKVHYHTPPPNFPNWNTGTVPTTAQLPILISDFHTAVLILNCFSFKNGNDIPYTTVRAYGGTLQK